MKFILSVILIGVALLSCKTDVGKPMQLNQREDLKDTLDIQHNGIEEIDKDEVTLNKTDSKGLKQGIWETKLKNKLWKRDIYKDGKLHGKCIEYLANGQILETNYSHGARDGYSLHFDPKSSTARFVTYWINGKQIWSTFPNMIEQDFVSIKGFIYDGEDNIEIKVPYNSGKILLVGSIAKNGKPIGKHTIYYESQTVKAIVNYETDSIKTFGIKGNLLENRAFKGMELTIYDKIIGIGN